MPKAIAEGSNGRMALSPLVNVGRKHILMARSIAEGPNSTLIIILSLKFAQTFTNGNYTSMI